MHPVRLSIRGVEHHEHTQYQPAQHRFRGRGHLPGAPGGTGHRRQRPQRHPPGREGVRRVDQGPRGAGADHRVGRRRRPPRGLPGAAPHPGRGIGRNPGRARPGPCRHPPRGGGPGHRPARGERAPGRDARRRGTRRDRAAVPARGLGRTDHQAHRDHPPDGGRGPHRLRQPDRPGADGRHRHDVGGGRDVRRVRGRPAGDPGPRAGAVLGPAPGAHGAAVARRPRRGHRPTGARPAPSRAGGARPGPPGRSRPGMDPAPGRPGHRRRRARPRARLAQRARCRGAAAGAVGLPRRARRPGHQHHR
jgi:hypothetical protein